jgi:DNA-binding PadR family transcriptional regulator
MLSSMADQSPATYGLLGMLAARSWTGYELTRQVARSLRFVWPTSEGHLYREQKRLVDLGWATVEPERTGRRTRNRYTITPAGRRALGRWLATEPEEPHLQIEGVLRLFYANIGNPDDLRRSMAATAERTAAMLADLRGFVREYLAEGGPLAMLEQGHGGPRARRTFAGRTMFPERLPSVALAVDITTQVLELIERFFRLEGPTAGSTVADPSATRHRLEGILDRAEQARAEQARAPVARGGMTGEGLSRPGRAGPSAGRR